MDTGPSNRILDENGRDGSLTCSLTVSEGGVVNLLGRDPYSKWAETSAVFSDGGALVVASNGPPGAEVSRFDMVKLWIEVQGWLFVGTEDEFKSWLNNRTVGRIR